MSWDRRQFLKALGCLIAATGVDPSSAIENLADAPIEEIKRAMSSFTMRIGDKIFPLLSVSPPRMPRMEIDVTNHFHEAKFPGSMRMSEMQASVSDEANDLLAANMMAPTEVEIRLKDMSYTFKAFLKQIDPGEDKTDIALLPSGPMTLTVDGGAPVPPKIKGVPD